MTRQALGISPRLDHDALHLRTHEKGSQNIFFTPPNAITIERKRPTPTKIPEAIWVNSPKSSADDNFAKDVIAFYLHSCLTDRSADGERNVTNV